MSARKQNCPFTVGTTYQDSSSPQTIDRYICVWIENPGSDNWSAMLRGCSRGLGETELKATSPWRDVAKWENAERQTR